MIRLTDLLFKFDIGTRPPAASAVRPSHLAFFGKVDTFARSNQPGAVRERATAAPSTVCGGAALPCSDLEKTGECYAHRVAHKAG
eukprot:scaffold12886_cov107-Isochrysis_galbana.AAC.5